MIHIYMTTVRWCTLTHMLVYPPVWESDMCHESRNGCGSRDTQQSESGLLQLGTLQPGCKPIITFKIQAINAFQKNMNSVQKQGFLGVYKLTIFAGIWYRQLKSKLTSSNISTWPCCCVGSSYSGGCGRIHRHGCCCWSRIIRHLAVC